MSKSALYIIVILIFIVDISSGQVYPTFRPCNGCTFNAAGNVTYGALDTFEIGDVTSDYGPRYSRANPRYSTADWHGGVDFGPDTRGVPGDLILSLTDGNIHELVTGRMKYVYIDDNESDHDWGYIHFFDNGESYPQDLGGCQIAIGLSTRRCFVVPDSIRANGSVNSYRAFAPRTDRVVLSNGDTISVERTISQGQVVGPMGKSISGRQNGFIHVHYSKFYKNNFSAPGVDGIAKNPMQDFESPKIAYEIQLNR